MTREEATTLFAYDSWANRLLLDAVGRLSHEELHRDRKISHASIFGTLVHIIGAQEVWLSRWKGAPLGQLRAANEAGELPALVAWWDEVRDARDGYVAGLTDEAFAKTIAIATTSGKRYSHSFAEMFRHLVNHSSYHRGQVASQLRALGEAPPATDLIRFYRER